MEGFDVDSHAQSVVELYFTKFIMGYPLVRKEDIHDIITRRLSRKTLYSGTPIRIEEKDEYYICTFYSICMLVFQRIGKKDLAAHFFKFAKDLISRLMLYDEEDLPENRNSVGLNFELSLNISQICIYLIGNGDMKKASIFYNIGMSFIQQVNLFGERERGFLIAYYGFCELMLFNEIRDQVKCFAIIVNKHLQGNLSFIQSSQFQTLESCMEILGILKEQQKNLIIPNNFDIPNGYETTLHSRFDIISSHFEFLRSGLELKSYMYLSTNPRLYEDRMKQIAEYIISLTSRPVFEDVSALIMEAVVLASKVLMKYNDPALIQGCYIALYSLEKRYSSVRKVFGDTFEMAEAKYFSMYNNPTPSVTYPNGTNYTSTYQ